jgi:Protein of unknown function (DUF1329)
VVCCRVAVWLPVIFLLCVARGLSAGAESNVASDVTVVGTSASGGTAGEGLPAGTRITMQNWRQYSQFMPDGMEALFEGKYYWKMPADVELDVGPTVLHPLPRTYLSATEQHRGQTKILTMPDGRLNVDGYEGGIPFPDPAAPDVGWKILANFWFRYIPHLVVNAPDNLGFSCVLDSYGSINCDKGSWVYRQLSFNTDPGVQPAIPGSKGKFYTTWFMIQEPEQRKYTATLTIGYADLAKPEDIYVFLPALRRAQQLSTAARCAASGSDTTPDDGRFGFEGNLPDFDASLRGEKRILSQMDVGTAGAEFPASYDMPLGWPKPSWGKWELREVYVLDVSKIPAKAAGYCYGKRTMYIDRQFYGALWLDLYDAKMQPWKFALLQPIVLEVPALGLQNSTGAQYSHYWDVQRQHATFSGPNDGHGYDVLINENAPKQYEDLEKYTTPSGLSEILR